MDWKIWRLAQRKLAAEEEQTSYAPRNPACYLKQFLVWGTAARTRLAGWRAALAPGPSWRPASLAWDRRTSPGSSSNAGSQRVSTSWPTTGAIPTHLLEYPAIQGDPERGQDL